MTLVPVAIVNRFTFGAGRVQYREAMEQKLMTTSSSTSLAADEPPKPTLTTSNLGRQALIARQRRYHSTTITTQLNQIYGRHSSKLHPAWRMVQSRSTDADDA